MKFTSISPNTIHAEALEPFRGLTLDQAMEFHSTWSLNDMEYGLTLEMLTILVKDSDKAQKIFKAFSKSASSIKINSKINALEILTAFILVAKGCGIKDKLNAVFTVFDFNDRGRISYDEVTILFISFFRAMKVATGGGCEPSDENIEKVTKMKFNPDGDVSKRAFEEFVSSTLIPDIQTH